MATWTIDEALKKLHNKPSLFGIQKPNAKPAGGVIPPTPSARLAKKKRSHKPKYVVPVVLAYFKECGLPKATPEYKFHPTRKWRFDFCFVSHKVALEVEGGVWVGGRHNRGSGYIKDMDKYNAAASMGFRVLRCTPNLLCMQETIDLIKTTIACVP